MTKLSLDVEGDVIGIPLQECLFCGNPAMNTRHHVIPIALNPKKNVTIPLCQEHKDICHPIVKQIYIPKRYREKLNTAIIDTNILLGTLKSLKASLKFNKIKSTTVEISNPSSDVV